MSGGAVYDINHFIYNLKNIYNKVVFPLPPPPTPPHTHTHIPKLLTLLQYLINLILSFIN